MGMGPVVAFSHLRWDFVFQRPQHLMTRFASEGPVWFLEEPVLADGPPRLGTSTPHPNVTVAVPHLPALADPRAVAAQLRPLIDLALASLPAERRVFWYYTPMALPFSAHLRAGAVVYDCMDELSAFAGAPPALRLLEQQLLARADVVFTGGHSLYAAKRKSHRNVHAFPSSVEVAHYRRARTGLAVPPDLAHVPRPRLGYFGVIDERLDYDLLASLAAAHPAWSFVMVGPVVKVDRAALPQAPNIHWLGQRRYEELPAYVGAWDVALMPFAQNEATRYISPTKTLEYLAAGVPVVSTPIRDVVNPYGRRGLVCIAEGAPGFGEAVERCLAGGRSAAWLAAVDALLARTSWDRTYADMRALVQRAILARRRVEPAALIAARGSYV